MKKKDSRSLAQQCTDIGVELETLYLDQGSGKGRWTQRNLRAEEAVLEHFKNNGWDGVCTEGNLIQQVINACSYAEGIPAPKISKYPWNTAFSPHACKLFNIGRDEILKTIKTSNKARLIRNWKTLTDGKLNTLIDGNGYEWTAEESLLEEDPSLTSDKALGLFETLGVEFIYAIAEIYSSDTFKYRNGWADLTIWRDDDVRFIEVKAMKDKLHESQFVHVNDIVKKVGLNYSVVHLLALD